MQFNYDQPMHPALPSHIKALSPDFETPHFKQALSRFATGVTVITTFAPGARKGNSASNSFVGITASSFNSVSLTPPFKWRIHNALSQDLVRNRVGQPFYQCYWDAFDSGVFLCSERT